jgi:hypothetical protein
MVYVSGLWFYVSGLWFMYRVYGLSFGLSVSGLRFGVRKPEHVIFCESVGSRCDVSRGKLGGIVSPKP